MNPPSGSGGPKAPTASTYSRLGSQSGTPGALRSSSYNSRRTSVRWPGVGTSSPNSGQWRASTSSGSIRPLRTSGTSEAEVTMPTTRPSGRVAAAPLNPATIGCPCPCQATSSSHSPAINCPETARYSASVPSS